MSPNLINQKHHEELRDGLQKVKETLEKLQKNLAAKSLSFDNVLRCLDDLIKQHRDMTQIHV